MSTASNISLKKTQHARKRAEVVMGLLGFVGCGYALLSILVAVGFLNGDISLLISYFVVRIVPSLATPEALNMVYSSGLFGSQWVTFVDFFLVVSMVSTIVFLLAVYYGITKSDKITNFLARLAGEDV